MENNKFITKEDFFSEVKKMEGDHWTPESIDSRWDYHSRTIELLKGLNVDSRQSVLEMGTMGITCVKNADTIDFIEKWDFSGKKPTYVHDARKTPWPITDKKYDVFVALRVYMHLAPKQEEALNEAFRIAKKVIIVTSEHYVNEVHTDSKGMTYKDTVSYLNGIHPNLYLPTAMGSFFYWDTEIPSKLNIENVMQNSQIITYAVQYKSSSVYRKIKKGVKKRIKTILKK